MRHTIVSKFNIELEGRYNKPLKIRWQGKIALSTIQLIERLHVLRNAHDQENCSTNGLVCSSEIRSANIRGLGCGASLIAA
jgi:hypothetical protein